MLFQFMPYALPSSSAAILLTLLAAYGWRKRAMPGAAAFVLGMLAAAEWALAGCFWILAGDLPSKLFWDKAEYLGIVVVPLALLAFTLEYTGRGSWLTTRNMILSTLLPTFTLLLAWTNEFHHLFYTDIRLDTTGPVVGLTWSFGPGFWLLFGNSYLCLAASIGLLLEALVAQPRLYRRQIAAVLLGVSVAVVVNVLDVAGWPFPYFDLTPSAFILTGLAIAWSAFRSKLLNITPVARAVVIDETRDGMMVLDTQDRIVDLNPAAQQIFGKTAAEAISQPVRQVLSQWPDLIEKYRDIADIRTELALTQNAIQRQYDLHVSLLRDRRGRPLGRLLVWRDITVQKQAETELRESEERYRALFAAAQRQTQELTLLDEVRAALARELELPLMFRAVVEAVARNFGYSLVSIYLLQGDTLNLQYQVGYDHVLAQIPITHGICGRVARTGQPALVEDTRADAEFLEAVPGITSEVCVPLCDQGRTVGIFNIESGPELKLGAADLRLMTALSEHISVALRRAQLYGQVSESERRYRLLADNLTDVIWTMDLDLHLTYITPSITRLRGYSVPETMGEPLEHALTPDAYARALQLWQSELESAATGHLDPARISVLDLEQTRKDGSTVWTEVHLSYLRDEKGAVIGLLGVTRDITERKRGEFQIAAAMDELRRAKEAAEAANRAKSAFLANMSHELRTPLTAILGFTELMGHDPSLTPSLRENLEIVGRSGEHLLALINEVLELSKIETGRVESHRGEFDLYRLLQGLAEMFRLRAESKGLRLAFDRAPHVPRYIRADEGKLRQVLINLLGNAVKFTVEGGVTLRVESGPGAESLVFEIQDTGVGIAAHELDSIFDAFVQTASGRQAQQGTGLGLTISRQYVRLLGGELTVSSQVGQGSVFRFAIPFEPVAKAKRREAKSAAAPTRVLESGQRAPGGEPFRLLVAEDEEANRRLLVKLLRPLGFEVREAVNGQEAIELWETWKPHLIWMDMRMPVLDGHAATQWIKAEAKRKGVPTVIVALTASAFAEERDQILGQGCDDFVRKPFREADILDALTRHLGIRFLCQGADGDKRDGEQLQPGEMEPTQDAMVRTLAGMPAGWLAELRRAAIQGDLDWLASLVKQIQAANPIVADRLLELISNFEHEQILQLVEQAGPQT